MLTIGEDLAGWRVEYWYELSVDINMDLSGDRQIVAIGYFSSEEEAEEEIVRRGRINVPFPRIKRTLVLTKSGRTGLILGREVGKEKRGKKR